MLGRAIIRAMTSPRLLAGVTLAFSVANTAGCGERLIPAASPEGQSPVPESVAASTVAEDEADESTTGESTGSETGATGAEKEVSPASEALAAGQACVIDVRGVLLATRAGGGIGNTSCQWELYINGKRYKYTGSVRTKGRDPDRACADEMDRIERRARTVTNECRDLTVTDARGYGLQPMF